MRHHTSVCSELMHVETLASESDERFFYEMCNQAHRLHFVLPPLASPASIQTRPKGHLYELPA